MSIAPKIAKLQEAQSDLLAALQDEMHGLDSEQLVRLGMALLTSSQTEAMVHHSYLQLLSERLKKRGSLAVEQMVDLGWAARELKNRMDDLRKDAAAREELAGKLIALAAMESATDTEAELTFNGKYARGTVDMKMVPEVPQRGTPEFDALCGKLGVDPKLFDPASGGFLSINWKKAVDVLTAQTEEGQRGDMQLQRPQYRTKFVTKT